MARIFTTRFTFNDQEYGAIVTILTNNGKSNFTVKVTDEALFDLLPDGMLNYEDKNGPGKIASGNYPSQSLVNAIAISIEQHLCIGANE